MRLSRLREAPLSDLKGLLRSKYISSQMKIAIRKEILRRKNKK